MIKFIVIVFSDEEKADKEMSALNALQYTDGSVTVYGAALLGRDKNGNLMIKQKTGEIGISIGAIIAEVLEEGTDAFDTRMKTIGGTVLREWRDDIEEKG